MFGFRRKGRFFTRDADNREDASEQPEVIEDASESMQHIQRCYLVRSVIEDLARVDERIHDMVLEDRIGFEGPGLFAPVDHVIIYADDLQADVTELSPLQVLVAIAQLIEHARTRSEAFALEDEMRAARDTSFAL